MLQIFLFNPDVSMTMVTEGMMPRDGCAGDVSGDALRGRGSGCMLVCDGLHGSSLICFIILHHCSNAILDVPYNA